MEEKQYESCGHIVPYQLWCVFLIIFLSYIWGRQIVLIVEIKRSDTVGFTKHPQSNLKKGNYSKVQSSILIRRLNIIYIVVCKNVNVVRQGLWKGRKTKRKSIQKIVHKLVEQIRRIHYTCSLPLFVISYGRILPLFAWLFQNWNTIFVLLTNTKALFSFSCFWLLLCCP